MSLITRTPPNREVTMSNTQGVIFVLAYVVILGLTIWLVPIFMNRKRK